MSDARSSATRSADLRPILRSVALNAAVPVTLYWLSKRYVTTSEVTALSIAAVFPAIGSVWSVIRRRKLDVIAALALLSIAVSMAGVALGGSPKILLIRESFFSGALGLACFLSLLMPRPLMFYFGRQFMAGDDPTRIARFNAQWRRPAVRRLHRLITMVWGTAFGGEFALRVVLILTLPPVVVLAVAPFLTGAIVALSIIWTFAYVGRRLRQGLTNDDAARRRR